jgi:hypothetical protein
MPKLPNAYAACRDELWLRGALADETWLCQACFGSTSVGGALCTPVFINPAQLLNDATCLLSSYFRLKLYVVVVMEDDGVGDSFLKVHHCLH